MMRPWIALLLLLAAAGSAAAQPMMVERPPAPPGLTLSTGFEGNFDVLPGTARSFTLTLANEGNETLELDLRAEEMAPPAERTVTVRLDRSQVTLAPGDRAEVDVNVTVPEEAEENASTHIVLLASRSEPRQMADKGVPIRFGAPCPDCPVAAPRGATVTTSPYGGGDFHEDGDVVMRRPGNATPREDTPRPEGDPYAEVPGPALPLLLGAGGLAVALRGRRGRVAAVLTLLALAPLVSAQPTPPRAFAVTSVARDGEDVVVTLVNSYESRGRVIVSLFSTDGVLLAPEVLDQSWSYRDKETFRFANVSGSEAELRVRSTAKDGTTYEDRFLLRFDPSQAPRVILEDVALREDLALEVTFANLGDAPSKPLVVHVEDEQGKRLGSPSARRVAPIAPGERAELAFTLPDPTRRATVVVDAEGNVTRHDVRLADVANATRIQVAGLARNASQLDIALAQLGGPRLANAVAYLETTEGLRVGAPSAQIADGLSLRFTLDPDVEEVVLVVQDDRGEHRFPLSLIESDGADEDLEVDTDLPSREQQPGGTANYAITLTNNGDETLVSVRAEGLPEEYQVSFSVDGSAIRNLVLGAEATRTLTASVSVPQGASRDAGKTLPFRVVIDPEEGDPVMLELALTVRGEPRLELTGQNWFVDATPGQTRSVSIAVRNAGSAPARDIELEVAAPAGWRVDFVPSAIQTLEPGATRNVEVQVTPPEDVGIGRYLLDVGASNSDISARSRSLSVEVAGETSSRVGWIIGAGVAALAGIGLIIALRRR